MISSEDQSLLDTMLAPVSAEAPSGRDMRHETAPQSAYSRLRDLRAEARAEERALDNDLLTESRPPSGWGAVEALATRILCEDSKDLEIASWLSEALVRRRGLPGLELAAALVGGLVRGFWERGLFPAPDPEDPEARVFAVGGLSGVDRDGSLMQPLRKQVLFETPDGAAIAFWQFERAQSVSILGEAARKQQQQKSRAVPFATLEAIARSTGQAALLPLGRAVRGARTAWGDMERAFADAGGEAPSTGRVATLLAEIEQVVLRFVPETALQPAPEPAEEQDMAAGTDDPAGDAGTAPTPRARPAERTREELLDDVLEIAVLFRKNEPNSPLGYTLEEAVRRARLPLPDLLREIIPEPNARSGVLTLLGIRPSEVGQ